MNDEEVLIALRALAENDGGREAPAAVEARLRSAFRKKYSRPKWPYFVVFAMAAAAALVLFLKAPSKPQVILPAPEVAIVAPPSMERPVARPVVRKALRERPTPKEVVTDFFPLMEDPQPFERGELLRVSVPASTMRTVGLPVSEDRLSDRVQADVLLGEEGLARAIRFVRYVN